MFRIKQKIVAGFAGISLVVLGLPSIAQAEEIQSVGTPLSAAEASKQLKILQENDDLQGPALGETECTAGQLSDEDKQKFLKSLNAVRALARVEPVVLSDNSDTNKAYQDASISMTTQGNIDHGLGRGTFPCSNNNAVIASNAGNLSIIWSAGGKFTHVSNLVRDIGEPTLGHRLAMLDNGLKTTAVGVTHKPSDINGFPVQLSTLVMMVGNGFQPFSNQARRDHGPMPDVVAWPSPGFFPKELLKKNPQRNQTPKWSFAAKGVNDISDAHVTVTMPNGEKRTPSVEKLNDDGVFFRDSGAGYSSAARVVAFDVPEVTIAKGKSYETVTVKVEIGGKTWTYPVKVFSELNIKAPTFDTNLPAEKTIVEGAAAVNVPVKITGFPEFTYKVEKKAKDSQSWETVTTEATAKSKHEFNIAVASTQFKDGDQVRVVATQDSNNVESNTMTVHVVPALKVSATASVAKVVAGTQVTLTAKPTAGIDNVSVKWQSKKGDAQWADVKDATGTTLKVSPTAADDGIQYRAVASSTEPTQGPVESNAVTINVDAKLSIKTQPVDVATFAGQPVTFTVTADPGDAKIQWQKQAGGNGDFKDITGANQAIYTVDNPTKGSKDRFRAVVTYKKHMENPQTATSNEVGYTIIDALDAGNSKPEDVAVNEGAKVSFTSDFNVKNGMTYQWQRQASGKTEWVDITGATSKDYSFNATMADNGAKYRVKGSYTVSSKTSNATSREAVLTVYPLAKFTKDPEDQSVVSGTEATFSVETNGVGTLKWQSKKGNGDWTDIAGQTGKTLTVTAADADNGTKYRAVITAQKDQIVYSKEATLTVIPKLESASIAADKTTVTAPATVKLTLTSKPEVNKDDAKAPQVTWQILPSGNKNWEALPGNEATLDYQVANANDDGAKIRAVVTAPGNQSKTTNEVALKVNSKPVVQRITPAASAGNGSENSSYVIGVEEGKGLTLSLDVVANPMASAFAWEQFVDGTWKELTIAGGVARSMSAVSVASPKLYIPANKVVNGAKYRLKSSNQIGYTYTYVTLKVKPKGSTPGKTVADKNNSKHKAAVALAKTGRSANTVALLALMLVAAGAVTVAMRRRA